MGLAFLDEQVRNTPSGSRLYHLTICHIHDGYMSVSLIFPPEGQ